MTQEIESFVEALGWSLLHSLWQGTAMGLLLMLILWLVPGRFARARYFVSGFAFLVMLVAFFATVAQFWPRNVPLESPESGMHEVGAVESPLTELAKPEPADTPYEFQSVTDSSETPRENFEPEAGLAERVRPLLPWCVSIWTAGVLFFFLRFLVGLFAVRKWTKSGDALTDRAWKSRISRLCKVLQISRSVRVLSSAKVAVPVVVGWLKPVVLVPVGLFSGLSTPQLEAIIAHELAHIRRHDYLVNLLQNLAEAVFFYHPVVWWISAQMRKERENCCDDLAAAACGGVLDYARALTALEEIRGITPAYGVSASGGSLIQRIRRLLGVKEEQCKGCPIGVLALGLALVVALFLPVIHAQSNDPTTPQASHITNGDFSSYCAHDGKDAKFVIITTKSLTVDEGTTPGNGSLTWDVSTTDKTNTLYFAQKPESPDLVALKNDDFEWYNWDLNRGRVFWLHYGNLEFTATIYQIPIDVEAVTTPEILTKSVAKASRWLVKADDETRWKQTRILVDEDDYKPGKPLEDDEQIIWGEPNEVGLRLGLGGVKPNQTFPMARPLPLKHYFRNDGKTAVKFSSSNIFGDGQKGYLEDEAGNEFPHRNGYPWPLTLNRHRLEPGHFKEFTSGALVPLPANKDSSAAMDLPGMGSGMVVQPGDYILHLTQIVGEYIGIPVNTFHGDPRIAPGIGEWTGRLHSDPLPLKITSPVVSTAKPGDVKEFGKSYRIDFKTGEMTLTMPLSQRSKFEVSGGSWNIKTKGGEYQAAWDEGGKRLWLKNGNEIQKLRISRGWIDAGRWPLSKADGPLGDMPDGVRKVLNLPALKEITATPKISVRGRSLDGIGSTSDRSLLDELYDQSGKLKANIFEMPLFGESGDPTLFVTKVGTSYYVSLNEKVYGPIEGDPAMDLNLYLLMQQKLAEVPNVEGLTVLERMIKVGNGPLLNLSYRILGELKEPQAPVDYDGLFYTKIRATIADGDGPQHLGAEARLGGSKFGRYLHNLREDWEQRRIQSPEDRYQGGEKMTGENASIVWSPQEGGISLGVSGLPSGKVIPIGNSIPVEIFIRNDGKEPLKFSSPKDANPQLQISLSDSKDRKHPAKYRYSGGFEFYHHTRLDPGFGIKVQSVELENYATAGEIRTAGHKDGHAQNPRMAVAAGTYSLELEYRVGKEKYKDFPKTEEGDEKLEWTGLLKSKPVEIRVKLGPRILRGLNLDDFPSHPASPGFPHAFTIEELYVENPNAPGKMIQKRETFDMPISGERGSPWLKIVPKSGNFYIEFTDRTYGPVPGDPLELMDLHEQLRARLQSMSPKHHDDVLEKMITHHSVILQNAAYENIPHLEGLDKTRIKQVIEERLKRDPDAPKAKEALVYLEGVE